jgi:hypothetical protein
MSIIKPKSFIPMIFIIENVKRKHKMKMNTIFTEYPALEANKAIPTTALSGYTFCMIQDPNDMY